MIETFEHGADIGVRGRGADLSEAFANGARAMFSLMVENLDAVRAERCRRLACESFDLEGLFVAWLNSLIAEADVERLIFSKFSLCVADLRLEGTACGEPFDASRHERGVEVKGATFTELRVGREGNLWVAQCVVDV